MYHKAKRYKSKHILKMEGNIICIKKFYYLYFLPQL